MEMGKAHSRVPGFIVTSACRTQGQHFLIKQIPPVALSPLGLPFCSPLFAAEL